MALHITLARDHDLPNACVLFLACVVTLGFYSRGETARSLCPQPRNFPVTSENSCLFIDLIRLNHLTYSSCLGAGMYGSCWNSTVSRVKYGMSFYLFSACCGLCMITYCGIYIHQAFLSISLRILWRFVGEKLGRFPIDQKFRKSPGWGANGTDIFRILGVPREVGLKFQKIGITEKFRYVLIRFAQTNVKYLPLK